MRRTLPPRDIMQRHREAEGKNRGRRRRDALARSLRVFAAMLGRNIVDERLVHRSEGDTCFREPGR